MAVIYAAPYLGPVEVRGPDGTLANTLAFDLQTAINRARPGDTVHLVPGRYPTAATVPPSSGNAAITIAGPDDGSAVLDGGRPRDHGRHSGMEPLDSDFAFLKLVRARKVVLKNLTFENCWPSAIYIRASQDIAIVNCTGIGGRYFIYARQLNFMPTRRVLLDGVTWLQDPAHDMWTGRIVWQEVKAQRGEFDASFFNGAMFGSYNVKGDITIRNCAVSHAFNVIRMDMDSDRVDGTLPDRNRNVFIHDNSFAFIRDNAIEPEAGAAGWYVFNNRFFNVHAAFSLDGVACQDMFYAGNLLLNNRKPGRARRNFEGGKIFKFLAPKKDTDGMETEDRVNLWSFYNSVLTRTSFAKKGRTGWWRDAYSAVQLLHKDYPDLTKPPRPLFAKFEWEGDILLRGMVTNDPDYPDAYPRKKIDPAGMPRLKKLFKMSAFDICPDDPLGGWNGTLRRVRKLAALQTAPLCITRDLGGDFILPGGLAPGAHPVEDLGLDWAEAAPLPDIDASGV